MSNPCYTVVFSCVAPCTTTINVVYTNENASADAWIDRVEVALGAGKQKIVGVDMEFTPRVYTRRGYEEKAAVIQLCVGKECLVYHIGCFADGISAKFDDFLRNWSYKFAGIHIHKDQKKLYRFHTPLFIMNHKDIHETWRDPDTSSRRKQSIRDVAGVVIDISYKGDDGMTDDDHRLWGVAPLSQKHMEYAAVNAYAAYDVYRRLDVTERGFWRLHKKKAKEQWRE